MALAKCTEKVFGGGGLGVACAISAHSWSDRNPSKHVTEGNVIDTHLMCSMLIAQNLAEDVRAGKTAQRD